MEKDFIKWFKKTHRGWVADCEIPLELRESLNNYLKNTNKIGVYIYHRHQGTSLKFMGMGIGYYVRTKNIFKWNSKATAGNH